MRHDLRDSGCAICRLGKRPFASQCHFDYGDDQGWGETGYHSHPHLKTPVLDEMASRGLRMDRFYAAHVNCSPTRTSVLTGRHPIRSGVFGPNWSTRPEEITIGHVLRQAGYRTGHFGKWHVGAVKAASPTNPAKMGWPGTRSQRVVQRSVERKERFHLRRWCASARNHGMAGLS